MLTTEQIRELIRTNNVLPFYNDRTWRKLSKEVQREQHNECQRHRAAGKYAPAHMVHHVNHLRDRPDLAYSKTYIAPDGTEQRNLVALCHECHELEHPERIKKKQNRYKADETWEI